MNVLTAVKQIESKYPVQRIADDFTKFRRDILLAVAKGYPYIS